MGQYTIKMPDIGEGIAEVELVAWRVNAGDDVKEDQVLADVMTDKATVEIPSPVAGKVLSLGAQPGTMMAVGAELIRLEVQGAGNVRAGAGSHRDASAQATPASAASSANVGSAAPDAADASAHAGAGATREESSAKDLPPDLKDSVTRPNPAPDTARGATPPSSAGATPPPAAHSAQQPVAPAAARQPPRATQPPTRPAGDKPIASPAVRRRAWELGIELQFVHGSGPAGRITHEDLDVYLASRGQPGAVGNATLLRERHDEQEVPVIGLRRRIAQKMQDAKRRIPHFSYVEEIDVTELEALRAKINAKHAAQRGKLTMLPFIARAVVLAVEEFPQLNARFDDDKGVVTRHGAVHLGIATQTDNGLVVPVLRHAEAQDVWACGREIARLAEAARTGKATREELGGSTITITSLGALGGIASTPVINSPEVAIVGVNRIVKRPVFDDAGNVVARLMMNLSSSFDHRVVDGMDAARFVQSIRGYLEAPALLFVESR